MKNLIIFFVIILLSGCFIENDSSKEGVVPYHDPTYGGNDSSNDDDDSDNSIDPISSSTYETSEYFLTSSSNRQNFLGQINASKAYAHLASLGLNIAGDGIRVAVVDSGVQSTHSDLDDNFSSASQANQDDDGHGTSGAGVIAAEKNGLEMHGVAFNAEIYAIALNDLTDATGASEYGISDFDGEVIASNALVINNSWGFGVLNEANNVDTSVPRNPNFIPNYTDDRYLTNNVITEEEIRNIINNNTKRVVVFAASNDYLQVRVDAGNNLADNPGPPANYADSTLTNGQMLAVAAIGADSGDNTNDGAIAYYSNRCGVIAHCLSAPGGDAIEGRQIYTTDNNGSYTRIQGTSFSTPVVSGAAAVLHGAWDNLSGSQVVDILLDTANKTGIYAPNYDSDSDGVNDLSNIYGAGRLDLENAVRNQGRSSASTSLSLQSYSYDSTSLNIPQNLQILQNNKNFQSLLAKGVFFDKYNRDYKANYVGKVSYYGAGNSSLESRVLNNQEVKNVQLGISRNLGASFANVKQKEHRLNTFFSPEKNEIDKTFLSEANYQISALGQRLKMNFSFSESSPLSEKSNSDLLFSNNNFVSFYEQNSDNSYYNFDYNFSFNDRLSFSNNFIYADNEELNTNIMGVDNKLIQKFKTIAIEYNFSMLQEGSSFSGISGNEAFDFADFTRNDSFGVTIKNSKNRKFEYSFSSNFSTITPEYKSNLFSGSKSYNAFNYNLLMSYQASKNNKLGVAISKPWQIEKGEFSITIPTGIDANNVVETDSVNIDFSSIKSYDFEAFWHKNLTTNSKIKFNSLYKVYDTNKVDFIEDLDDRLELFINYIKEF